MFNCVLTGIYFHFIFLSTHNTNLPLYAASVAYLSRMAPGGFGAGRSNVYGQCLTVHQGEGTEISGDVCYTVKTGFHVSEETI